MTHTHQPASRLKRVCQAMTAFAFVASLHATEQPNIVVILADDLDITASPVWEAMPITRTLLRDRGLELTNARSPTAICCPARASLLTGQYAHNTGVYNNAGETGGMGVFNAKGNEQRTVAVHLQNAGYQTCLIGKYLNGIENDKTHIPAGWSNWQAFVDDYSYTGYDYAINDNGTMIHYGFCDTDYGTDVVARRAVEYITAQKGSAKPFYLQVCPTAPHIPIPPARRHRNHDYVNAECPRTENYIEADVSDKSSWLRDSAEARAIIAWFGVDHNYPDRMGSLYALDELVGSVVGALRKTGTLDNTIIVFLSDQGYNNGSHRLVQKMAPYEESQRIPCVITGPGIRVGHDDHLSLIIDVAPTVLAAAGQPVPAEMDGVPWQPLLSGNVGAWRHDYLMQYKTGIVNEYADDVDPFGDLPSYRGVRNENSTFVQFYAYEDIDMQGPSEDELYNNAADPFQLENQLATPAGAAANAAQVKRLETRIEELLAPHAATELAK